MAVVYENRNQVPEEYTWNLGDIFPSEDDWNAEYEALKNAGGEIAARRGTLGRSAADLLSWLKLQDEMSVRLEKFYGYASCRADEDTGDSARQNLRGKAMGVLVAIQSAASFATPEIMAIPEETLAEFYRTEPELEIYRRTLYRIRRRAEHVLSPECEQLLAAAGEMANAPENIASVFRNADITFPSVTDSAGVSHTLTNGSFVPLQESPDREFRRRTFETYYGRLGEFKNTAAAALDGQFKQLRFFADARRYPDTRTAALDVTEVPVSVYDNLIDAVHANLDKMYRYVALRRDFLGVRGTPPGLPGGGGAAHVRRVRPHRGGRGGGDPL